MGIPVVQKKGTERVLAMDVTISPKRITRILICVLLFLTLADVAGILFKHFINRDFLLWLVPKYDLASSTFILLNRILNYLLWFVIPIFDFGVEANIPTWYSSSMLLFCSILLAIISDKKATADRYTIHWRVLAIIFLFLSMDEACGFHEMTAKPLRAALNARGILYHTWVIPGAAFVLFFVLAYLRFLANLPAKIRRGFIIAGTLYVGGALCLELIEGNYMDFYGKQDMTYIAIMTIEEFLEMLGIIVFIHMLMSYISSYVKDVQIQSNDGG